VALVLLAYVSEQRGRRWITIDTSRVALARTRIMGARYPYYLLADSENGQKKEAEITRTAPSEAPTYNDIRQGFIYERVPHITLKVIASNTEIDVIWEKYQKILDPIMKKFNEALGSNMKEWEIPSEINNDWTAKVKKIHAEWWEQRIACQKEIEASIAAKSDFEYLYDKPYIDKRKIRVAGPFTVESLSPHRSIAINEDDDLVDGIISDKSVSYDEGDFVKIIIEISRKQESSRLIKRIRLILLQFYLGLVT
jgi:adenine-specific DNA-methyltransferase